MVKTQVPGVILIVTCKAYLSRRVAGNKFRLKGSEFNGWPIVYLVAEPELEGVWDRRKYNILNADSVDVLVVKTEDSYVNLFKKIAFGYRALHEIYDIERGILKCDDDMLLNKPALSKFVQAPPDVDYMGTRYDGIDYYLANPMQIVGSKHTVDVVNYYTANLQQLAEARKLVSHFNPDEYARIPDIPEGYGCPGGLCYLSTLSSQLVVAYFHACDNNVFYKDPYSNSYPFMCEDVGASFVLIKHGIQFTRNPLMFRHAWLRGGDIRNTIGFHTCLQGTECGIRHDIIDLLTRTSI